MIQAWQVIATPNKLRLRNVRNGLFMTRFGWSKNCKLGRVDVPIALHHHVPSSPPPLSPVFGRYDF